MSLDCGFISPYFVAEAKSQKLELEVPLSEMILLLQPGVVYVLSDQDSLVPARSQL